MSLAGAARSQQGSSRRGEIGLAFLEGSGPVLAADRLASAAAREQDQRVPSLGRLVDLASVSLRKFPHSKTLPGPSVWTLGLRSRSWAGMQSGLGRRAPRSGWRQGVDLGGLPSGGTLQLGISGPNGRFGLNTLLPQVYDFFFF